MIKISKSITCHPYLSKIPHKIELLPQVTKPFSQELSVKAIQTQVRTFQITADGQVSSLQSHIPLKMSSEGRVNCSFLDPVHHLHTNLISHQLEVQETMEYNLHWPRQSLHLFPYRIFLEILSKLTVITTIINIITLLGHFFNLILAFRQ